MSFRRKVAALSPQDISQRQKRSFERWSWKKPRRRSPSPSPPPIGPGHASEPGEIDAYVPDLERCEGRTCTILSCCAEQGPSRGRYTRSVEAVDAVVSESGREKVSSMLHSVGHPSFTIERRLRLFRSPAQMLRTRLVRFNEVRHHRQIPRLRSLLAFQNARNRGIALSISSPGTFLTTWYA